MPLTTPRSTSRRPDAKCPVRPGDPCSLCWPGATGPADCGLIYLVKSDPELLEQRTEYLRRQKERVSR